MAYQNTGAGKAVAGTVPNSFRLSNFDIEGAKLKPQHEAFLKAQVIPQLKDGVSIRLMGLTDRTGSDDYNNKLSDRRVESVRAFLNQFAPGPFEVRLGRMRGEQAAALMGKANGSTDADFRAVMLLIEGKSARPDVVKANPRRDFIVRFVGNDNDSGLDPEVVFSAKSIESATAYQSLLSAGRRTLVRLGHNTADANRKGKRDEARALIMAARRFDTLGLVILLGSSSGANNAIALMQELAGEGIEVQIVAISDVASFPNEARPRTLALTQTSPLPIPSFNVGPVSPGERLNFFQAKGNDSEISVSQMRLIYSSSMLNKEIHGKIDGFVDTDLSILCKKTDDFDLHVEVNMLAIPRMRDAVIAILNRAEELVPSAAR